MPDVDASEVHDFAKELHLVPEMHRVAVGRAVKHHTDAVAQRARTNAPKDRPWLSTPDGIQESFGFIGGNAVGSVWSGADPRGEFVGFRVEYGTSFMAPRPFMLPAFRQQRSQMIAEIASIMGSGW